MSQKPVERATAAKEGRSAAEDIRRFRVTDPSDGFVQRQHIRCRERALAKEEYEELVRHDLATDLRGVLVDVHQVNARRARDEPSDPAPLRGAS